MKEYLISLRKELEELPPDIAEKQKENKGKMGDILKKNSEVITENKDKKLGVLLLDLDSLLDMKYHYFEEGFICPYTPESLIEEIKNKMKEIEEIDVQNNEAKDMGSAIKE